MPKTIGKKVAFISSYIPRRCGIATFTSDLINNISTAANKEFEPLVVAMRSGDDKYKEPVKFEIRQEVKNDYISAADYINFSHVDIVSVQHEFGLYGGSAGSYLTELLNRLNTPIITTLHTVLDAPEPAYYKSLVEVCNASYKVIVMNERGVEMLRNIYGVPAEKIELIPHGIPDIPFVDTNYYKHKFGIEGKKTILTFGLLSRNKGIETMLKALPAIIEAEPSVLYIVLGMTHPEVLKNDGESYRFSLQRLVEELECTEHVMFHNRFVSDQELHNFLCAADIYATPYLNVEQLTSGTLSFAVGAGKAVVSTPYWAAQELLAEDRGKLVNFGDSKQLAAAIIEILKNESLFYSLRRKSYDYGRSRIWPKIGQIYWDMFRKIKTPVVVGQKTSAITISKGKFELPEPSLAHIKRLTDDVGILQHAKYVIPERSLGYCTDDNARAVITMSRYYTQYHDQEALKLLSKYLAFIIHSQDEDGQVRNFMNYDRSWQKDEQRNDALGRVLWALGTVMANPPALTYLPTIKDCFDSSASHVLRQMPKGMAYSIIGMSDYLNQLPGASDIKRQMELAADELMRQFEENAHPDWQWFEEILTYDNAILPYALFLAGEHLSDKYYEVAEKSCEFLLSKTFNGSHFSFVGSDGWYERGGTKAQFDQQPIEALSTILMLKGAYEAKGKAEYLWNMKKAFNWFLGENDLHIPVYNFTTQGCHDGLMQVGVNTNQGAESMLSFLLSLLTIIENYTLFEKIRESQESPQKSGPTTQIVTKEEQKIAQTGSGQEQQRIKDISVPDSNTNKNEVAESKQIN